MDAKYELIPMNFQNRYENHQLEHIHALKEFILSTMMVTDVKELLVLIKINFNKLYRPRLIDGLTADLIVEAFGQTCRTKEQFLDNCILFENNSLSDDQVIIWKSFQEALENLDCKEIENLTSFVTGYSKIPLRQKMKITFEDNNKMLNAHTCFYELVIG